MPSAKTFFNDFSSASSHSDPVDSYSAFLLALAGLTGLLGRLGDGTCAVVVVVVADRDWYLRARGEIDRVASVAGRDVTRAD